MVTQSKEDEDKIVHVQSVMHKSVLDALTEITGESIKDSIVIAVKAYNKHNKVN